MWRILEDWGKKSCGRRPTPSRWKPKVLYLGPKKNAKNTHKGITWKRMRFAKPLLLITNGRCQRGPMDLVESYLLFQLSIFVSKHHLFEEFCEKNHKVYTLED